MEVCALVVVWVRFVVRLKFVLAMMVFVGGGLILVVFGVVV